MSSYNRRSVILMSLVLGACGFTPVYGPESGASTLRNAVLVDAPNNTSGFDLVRQIEQRLGRPNTAQFRLAMSVKASQDGVAITTAQETTRYNILGTASYKLFDLSSGAMITSGSVRSATGYSSTGSTVSTSAAEDDAKARLIIILADQIITRLIAATS